GQHNHPSGWFLTQKHPLAKGGILALSQDLHTPTDTALRFSKLVEVVDHIRRNLDASLRAEDLCQLAEMSSPQLDRRMRKVFRLSTKQFVIKCRLEEATRLLTESEMPLAEIALTCGFSDQSALTRAFRLAFQHTPLEVRKNADQ
ncbi:MAG: AraC family transcriptional regulator, partial [Verrucomicrobiota bacterium]